MSSLSSPSAAEICLQCPSCLDRRPINAFKPVPSSTSNGQALAQVTPPDTPLMLHGRTLERSRVEMDGSPPTFALPLPSVDKGKAIDKPANDGVFKNPSAPVASHSPHTFHPHAHASSSSALLASSTPAISHSNAAISSSSPAGLSLNGLPQPGRVLVPKTVVPYVAPVRPPLAVGSDFLTSFLWRLTRAGACAWCYITLRGEISQHEHGMCADDDLVLTRFQEFKTTSISEICRAVKGSQAIVCVRCWAPWPKDKHGEFSRKKPCVFHDILAWLAFAILSDTDAQQTYRRVFNLPDGEFDITEMLKDFFEVRMGQLGMWNAVTGVVKAIELQKREGVDGAP